MLQLDTCNWLIFYKNAVLLLQLRYAVLLVMPDTNDEA